MPQIRNLRKLFKLKAHVLSALLPLSFSCLLNAQQTPLSTSGAQIIDANGTPFLIKGVNWWGANGSLIPYSDDHSKGTDTHAMPFGLHVQHLDTIVGAIRKAGFNTVRLPFSNQMLHDTTRALPEWVGPNSELIGLTPLQVLDKVIASITNEGLFVLLNNHSTTTHWCCNYDFNGLWFGKNEFYSQTTADWIKDWMQIADRYRGNPKVIGADLRNEVRPSRANTLPLPKNPNWGKKNKRDWHKAATEAGNAIHSVNPDWLIVVEGINARVHFLSKLTFPLLKPVGKRPITLNIPNKLIYEVHNYSFSWIKANVLTMKRQVRYMDVSTEVRMEQFEKNWGYITDPSFEHTTPVLLGEFGCNSVDRSTEPWLTDLTDFVQKKQISFCWWTLEEELYNNESYGLLNGELNSINVDQDWRWSHLKKLLEMQVK